MPSVFTSLVTEIVQIPHDAGQSVTIRKLNPRALLLAKQAQQKQAMFDYVAMMKDDPEAIKTIQAFTPAKTEQDDAATAKAKEDAKADPMSGFDRVTLMVHGVVGWTYEQARTAEAFSDLDDETQDLISRAILKVSKPALFQTVAQAETEQKND